MDEIKLGILDTKVTRRKFMAGVGGLTFSFTLGGTLMGRLSEAGAQAQAVRFNTWVSIAGDNAITVTIPIAEMGQGALTSLALILAEELDADWPMVKTEYSPPVPKTYGNYHPLFNGVMLTAASISVPGYYNSMRMAGAQTRRMLMESTAR